MGVDPKIGCTVYLISYLGVLVIRILLFRVLFLGSPIFGNPQMAVDQVHGSRSRF